MAFCFQRMHKVHLKEHMAEKKSAAAAAFGTQTHKKKAVTKLELERPFGPFVLVPSNR